MPYASIIEVGIDQLRIFFATQSEVQYNALPVSG
jgi:hypothetical protein